MADGSVVDEGRRPTTDGEKDEGASWISGACKHGATLMVELTRLEPVPIAGLDCSRIKAGPSRLGSDKSEIGP